MVPGWPRKRLPSPFLPLLLVLPPRYRRPFRGGVAVTTLTSRWLDNADTTERTNLSVPIRESVADSPQMDTGGREKTQGGFEKSLPWVVDPHSGGPGGLCGGWLLAGPEAAQIDHGQKDRVLEYDHLVVFFCFCDILRLAVRQGNLPIDVGQEPLDEAK